MKRVANYLTMEVWKEWPSEVKLDLWVQLEADELSVGQGCSFREGPSLKLFVPNN